MPCFSPLKGFRAVGGGIVFSRSMSMGLPMTVPCGRCIGCRLERSRQWAVRCMHEASLYEDNCFITLTYSEKYLPPGGSLLKSDFQKFMKRLRRRFSSSSIRFYHCGEYGENTFRPHYHALLFNFDFVDKVLWSERGSFRVYRSAVLEDLWSLGRSEIGSVTFESAAYVARYITKKVTGDNAESHYRVVDSDGVIVDRLPEYSTMSLRPGIGKGWYDKFKSDVYPSDEVIVGGRPSLPPKYYDSLLYKEDSDVAALVKRRRAFRRSLEDETPARLEVREVCTRSRLTRAREILP